MSLQEFELALWALGKFLSKFYFYIEKSITFDVKLIPGQSVWIFILTLSFNLSSLFKFVRTHVLLRILKIVLTKSNFRHRN